MNIYIFLYIERINMYQHEYLYLEIIFSSEDNVEDLLISLYGYLSFLEKIYLKVFLFIDTNHRILLPSSIHRIFKKYLNNDDDNEINELDIKKIELKSDLTPIQLYEEICKVPYSIRFYEKNLRNREFVKEEEYYKKHVERYHGLPYIFCTSQYNEENDNSIPIYILIHPYYHDNIYDTYWYDLRDRSKYDIIKIMENAEEIHIQSDEKEWMEIMYFLDLTKVKRRVIYYRDEEEIEKIEKYYPWLHFFHYIQMN